MIGDVASTGAKLAEPVVSAMAAGVAVFFGSEGTLNGNEDELLRRLKRDAELDAKYQKDFDDCMDDVMEKWYKQHNDREPNRDEFLDILDDVEDCLLDKGWPPQGYLNL